MLRDPKKFCRPNLVVSDSEIIWVQNTRIFKAHRAMCEEILKHKWIESEKAGYDIGWEKASTEWMARYGRSFKPSWNG